MKSVFPPRVIINDVCAVEEEACHVISDLAHERILEAFGMRRLMEITPFPTQRQRKELRNVQGVIGVTTDGDRAWVVHCVFPGRELALVERLSGVGFRVAYRQFDPMAGMRSAGNDKKARKKRRNEARKKLRKTRGT